MPPKHIAILGGGLTGLASAFHLSRRFPAARITIFEKQERLGGWVNSERVSITDAQGKTHSVLLESGPRTLRPNARAVLELINVLSLSASVITTSRTSPAARDRFLHIPGLKSHMGLLPLPSSPWGLLRAPRPIRNTLLGGILAEPFRSYNRHGNDLPQTADADESIDSFLSRRFSPAFAQTFGSALTHGIYAADSREVSVRAAFPTLWAAETRGRGSVIKGLLAASRQSARNAERAVDDYDLGDVMEVVNGAAVFSFHEGIGTLTAALERYIRGRPHISILTGTPVQSLKLAHNGDIEIDSIAPMAVTNAVSTIRLPLLDTILCQSPSAAALPHLLANSYTSVTVVNMVFPTSTPSFHPPGFGYLIPRPSSGSYVQREHNPLGVLGVIFDTCALSEQDSQPPLTKLTLMLGGPYVSAEEPTAEQVLNTLAEQLHVPRSDIPEPLHVRIVTHSECIPTPRPGHLARMQELQEVLQSDRGWAGKLEVVGAGVGGVSVNDCVEAGRKVGTAWT